MNNDLTIPSKKAKYYETRISESYKRKVIQTSRSMRLKVFDMIQQLLDINLKSNVQCLDKTDLSRLKNGYKGPYFLRDFFINLKQIGTPSVYGIVFVACINANMINHTGNRCYTICENFKRYEDLPRKFVAECDQKDQKLEPLEVAIKLQSLPEEKEHDDIVYSELEGMMESMTLGEESKLVDICPWNDPNRCETEMWREIRSTKLLTLLLRYGVCPNVPILYQVYLCNSCGRSKDGKVTIDERLMVKKDPCAIIVNELSNGDLKTWMKSPRSEGEWISTVFQISMGLLGMQLNFGMIHYDFHWGNQLWSKVQHEPWLYNIFDNAGNHLHSFMVPTYGNLFKIWDLGKVKSEIGLGRDYTYRRKKFWDKQKTEPVGGYFNDIFHILGIILFHGGREGTRKAPPGILNWIKHALNYLHYIDKSPDRSGVNPTNFARAITEIFKHENLVKSGIQNPPNMTIQKRTITRTVKKKKKGSKYIKIGQPKFRKVTKTNTFITDHIGNLPAQVWNVKQHPVIYNIAKQFEAV